MPDGLYNIYHSIIPSLALGTLEIEHCLVCLRRVGTRGNDMGELGVFT